MNATDFMAPYTIIKELGRGAFSIVYLAKERSTEKLVAIKVIEKDEETEDAVKKECSIQRQFESPYIVNIIAYFEDKEKFILVIEYVNGGELLDAILKNGVYTEFDAATIIQQTLVGLKILHDNNVIHRDLKPENILLEIDETTKKTTAKISDFGLADLFSEKKLVQYCGTEGYAAPEIMLHIPYDKSVDVWSLGVIVYVLLSGSLPFDAEDSFTLTKQICKCQPDFTSSKWSNISKCAVDFIQKMLQFEPEKRITVDEALKHEWITGNALKIELGDLREHLRKFNLQRKLKRVTNAAKVGLLMKKLSLSNFNE